MAGQSRITIYGALIANLLIATIKFIAAGFTGSSAMLSEGIHSTVDTGNQLLLLLGISRSKIQPDRKHPFGHGKELYFWTLIVAILIFGLGGGMSVYEGISHLQHPNQLQDPFWNYMVLGAAAVFEGAALYIAVKKFNQQKGHEGFWKELRLSKDPSLFVVIYEDTAALTGIVIAFLGVYLGHLFQNPFFDGIASVLIGILLAVVAIIMVIESKNLLVGESAEPGITNSIFRLVAEDRDVVRLNRPLTMHLSPDEILLNLDVEFRQDLETPDTAAAIDRIEKAIKRSFPEVSRISIEARNLNDSRPPGKPIR